MNQVKTYPHFSMILSETDLSEINADSLSEEATVNVRDFHKSVPLYSRTPLVEWKNYSKANGVKSVLIKDESVRFGLKAFKGLGGTYAMFRVICAELGFDHQNAAFKDLQTPDVQERIRNMVFITTTDGNHGKGVSWAAGLLGCKAYVYMPVGSVEARAQAIRDAGSATVKITDLKYDDCVRYTAELAKKNGWYLIQDTSWDGYEQIPAWIIEGYTTMFYEAKEQMEELGYKSPTHVFLQAGVGAMAGGMTGAIISACKDRMPVISIVEPIEAACIFESAVKADGKPHKATGSEITIMAGLNCGEPCRLTWPLLRDGASFYFACRDVVAAHGMRRLAAPLEGDAGIIAGESGAATMGILSVILERDEYREVRDSLGINEDSVILLINTEGDTDPEGYLKITRSKGPEYLNEL